MDLSAIKRCVIAPSIGIARVGNAPAQYFIGPEYPGQKVRPEGGFKDHSGRIKRQAARFRIYALDKNDKVLGEVAPDVAEITWHAHLANRKGAFLKFEDRYVMGETFIADAPPITPENKTHIRNADYSGDRSDLIIDPGPREITGCDAGPVRFDGGTFIKQEVPLGELRTDADGRLLVLGGFGKSASVKPNNPTESYANSDWWHDDVSDGPVRAEVHLPDGTEIDVRPAHVIVAPPNYAPDIENLRTLYDVCRDVGHEMGLPRDKGPVSFKSDVFPLLARMARTQWVNEQARRGHGPGEGGDFLNPAMLDTLSLNAKSARGKSASKTELDAAALARKKIFERLRNPNLDPDSPEAKDQANYRFMPMLAGDAGDCEEGSPKHWMCLLKSQYAVLEAWAKGDFADDWDGRPPIWPKFEEIDLQDRPHALTQGALQPCVGGPFFPGIEITFISQLKELYSEPFVINPKIEAGQLTQYMAVPWQSDFYQCHTHWWPAQRPDDVVSEKTYKAVIRDVQSEITNDGTEYRAEQLPGLLPPGSDAQRVTWARERFAHREEWARGVETSFDGHLPKKWDSPDARGSNALVELWDELGFVVGRPSPVPKSLRQLRQTGGKDSAADASALWTPEDQTVQVETERTPFAGINLREFYYYLSNIDSYPEFLPKARWLTDYLLKRSWDHQFEQGYPESWRFFEYSEELYDTRMQRIYDEMVQSGLNYDPADPKDNPNFRTREEFLVRITNFAPLNQNDGAWLHKATPAGPLDEVQSLLFSIWMDEAGDGEVHQNHCNIYTGLLKSLGIYLHDPRSRAYAMDDRFLDSAFAVPVLELAIAQFSQEYIPELIGFTLQLEWTVPGLYPVEKMCEYFGVDPHFYRLHIGIDNAADGHGAKAKEAVKLYLDQVRARGGEQAMRDHWRRIWNGFLAFGDTGTLGQDLVDKIHQMRSETPEAEVLRIIEEKAKYGALNHRDKTIGPNLINDWFLDPEKFAEALVDAGYIVPGRPDKSRFFELTSFNGPMFKVFNDEELAAWRRWTLWLEDRDRAGTKPIVDPGVAMAELVERLQMQAQGEKAHDAKLLKGIDPETGKAVSENVSWWLAQVRNGTEENTFAFMRALADPENGMITPGSVSDSVIVQDYLGADSRMGQAFERSDHLGRTFRNVIVAWINAGCPIPATPPSRSAPSALENMPPPDVHPRPRVRGMGGIH
ncbi:LodA/GoxA family CTQ-dependent oxidase [Marivita sp. S6314]|uniref:LodA/GoxA family CTQ-dependent oxidase n=1 Tax=Marivita sp. S6314 TaxID=2926406 RepID=UPI001FF4914F|nr:LodA/GoxA family CTQ-dependent oxidase [Marivita sp. S6314]MCK0150519.1 LodA/GoxA family CTQ-dependent oxidase [Marivita sp. S6314]